MYDAQSHESTNLRSNRSFFYLLPFIIHIPVSLSSISRLIYDSKLVVFLIVRYSKSGFNPPVAANLGNALANMNHNHTVRL